MTKTKLLFLAIVLLGISGVKAQTDTKPITDKSTTVGNESGISEINLSTLDSDDDSKSQSVSGLLHSTSDIFVSTAGFTLSAGSFKIRGYDSEYSNIYMNGILMNDAESGRPVWSEWGGLNDATRNKEIINGLNPTSFSFSNIGGSTNIYTRASKYSKRNKFSYALTNRSYTHRLMYTYSTGLMKNNWAFVVSGSRRWADEGNVKGTFYDGYSGFFAAEKKLNEQHSFALTFYIAPTTRGMQGASSQEVYDLVGDNHYNPNWGYQSGDKRNAKVRTTNEPTLILNHYWNIDNKTTLTSSFGVSIGEEGTTALNWYNAADPRPDYYRYLPSYQTDNALKALITDEWKNNSAKSQIDWDKLYQTNYLANRDNKQATYILENRHNDQTQYSLNFLLNKELNENINITSGLELRKYEGKHYKTIDDFLGGKYWVDIDQFAERDIKSNDNSKQNDLNNPNRIINSKTQKFGYDYNINVNNASYWAQAQLSYNRFEFYGAFNISETQFYRVGNMKNGRAPNESFGESKKTNYINFGIKSGLTYKITGRHYVYGNIAYMTEAPTPRNSFISPRIKSTLIPDLTDIKILSGDVNYIIKTPKLNTRLSLYQTTFTDLAEIRSFYHDDYRTYVNYSIGGIDKTHTGVELGMEYKLTSTITLSGVGTLSYNRYTSQPKATVSFENGLYNDTTETIYIKNFFCDGSPQTAGSIGIKYAHPKYWFFNANFNYFADNYLDFFYGSRTQAAVKGLSPGDPLIEKITKMEKLPSAYTLDASIGKSLNVKSIRININLSVSNILDNEDFKTGGYEYTRFDYASKNTNKFPPRYFYSFGRTYYLTIGFQF